MKSLLLTTVFYLGLRLNNMPPWGRVLVLACALNIPQTVAAPYTLQAAISRAHNQDPWITGSISRQKSLEAQSLEARTLPDPTVSIGLANLPLDTFDFNEQAMTQFKVGIHQTFPRGKTRTLRQTRLNQLSQMQPKARQDRQAKVALDVASLWLEVYRHEKIIRLIQADRHLFEHLVEVAQFSYTSTAGRAKQQDIISAQLELTRLDDRLTRLHLEQDTQRAQLAKWLNDTAATVAMPSPDRSPKSHAQLDTDSPATALHLLQQHPRIQYIDANLRAVKTTIDIAKQNYKPQWGVNASYGYREDDFLGEKRSDFFSVGVTLDIPLFTRYKQDKTLLSARYDFEAAKTERALALRQLQASYTAAKSRQLRLQQRKELYSSRLLKKIAEQAQAALTAYTHDNGDFYDVVRARIDALNARIEAIDIDVAIQKNSAHLAYLNAGLLSVSKTLEQTP